MNNRCNRCLDNKEFEKGYCLECLDDLISKVQAAKIIGVSLLRLERILKEFPEKLHIFPYMTQVRLSNQEVRNFIAETPNAKSDTGKKWSEHFLKCRSCKKVTNEHYGGGYCVECYENSREAQVLRKYLEGFNLAEIGEAFQISRERARQIFAKSTSIELSRISENLAEYQKKEILSTIEETYKQNRAKREYKKIIDDKYDNIVDALRTKTVLSEGGLLKVLELPASSMHLIDDEYPEFLELISENKNRWSWKHDKCRLCGKTENKHKRWGYCDKCYTRSDEWKKQQYSYRVNNHEKFRKRQKEYEKLYHLRPEVKARLAEYAYARRYDGKRSLIIERDNFACKDCDMSQVDHKAKYGLSLGVFHRDGNLKNNSENNLVTLCRSCMARRASAINGNLKKT